jgi:hypothetical protein
MVFTSQDIQLIINKAADGGTIIQPRKWCEGQMAYARLTCAPSDASA